MGRYKRDITFYNNRCQRTDELIADAHTCAQRKPTETIEIAAHLMSQAFEDQDSALMGVARELMYEAGSPCQFNAETKSDKASDFFNRPEAVVPEITANLLELSWEEDKLCFKNAVLRVMEYKKKDGGFLFSKNTQWIAVYRFAVDIGIMYDKDDPREPEDPSIPQYKVFSNFAHELQLDVNPPTRIPFNIKAIDSMGKDNYSRYRTRYPWSKEGLKNPSKGLTLYKELKDVYRNLEQCFYNSIEYQPNTQE